MLGSQGQASSGAFLRAAPVSPTGAPATRSTLGPRSFDLRGLRSADSESKRGGLVYVAVVTASLAVQLVAFGWATIPSLARRGLPGGVAGLDFGLLAGLGGAVGFGLLGIRRLLPGATELRVDHGGIHLTYTRDRREDLPWNRVRGFVLCDYRNSPETLRGGRSLSLRGPHLWSRRTLLTQEAFETILCWAEAEHVSVTVRAPGAGRGGATA
jgi:hypothetical protein